MLESTILFLTISSWVFMSVSSMSSLFLNQETLGSGSPKNEIVVEYVTLLISVNEYYSLLIIQDDIVLTSTDKTIKSHRLTLVIRSQHLFTNYSLSGLLVNYDWLLWWHCNWTNNFINDGLCSQLIDCLPIIESLTRWYLVGLCLKSTLQVNSPEMHCKALNVDWSWIECL